MDADEVIAADLETHRLNTEADTRKDKGKGKQPVQNNGKQAATVSVGEVARTLDTDADADEDTPLLAGDRKNSGGRDDGNGNDGEYQPPSMWASDSSFKDLPWWLRPSIYWIIPMFLLTTFAFGGTVVPRVNIIVSLVCSEYFSDRAVHDPTFQFMPVVIGGENPQCRTPEVQAMVAEFTLYGSFLMGLLSACSAPVLGSWSDRSGRLGVMALTTFGALFSELIIVIVAKSGGAFSVYWILAGYIVDGVCGTFVTGMAIIHAYASDCTPPHKRAAAFAVFHGCLFGGIGLGPLFSGLLVDRTGDLLSAFYVALTCHSMFVLWVLFVVPESLSKERQLAAQMRKALLQQSAASEAADHAAQGGRRVTRSFMAMRRSIGNSDFVMALRVLWPTGAGTSTALRVNLVSLAAVDFMMFGLAMGGMTVIILYAGYMFHWTTLDTSAFISIISSSKVLMLFAVMPFITSIARRWSRRGLAAHEQDPPPRPGCSRLDIAVIRASIFFDALGYFGYALATTGGAFVASGTLTALGALSSPTLQAALTKHVPADRTGQALGAMALLHGIARIVSPVVFNGIYAATVKTHPAAMFYCFGATFVFAQGLSWFVRPYIAYGEATPGHAEEEEGESRHRDEHAHE